MGIRYIFIIFHKNRIFETYVFNSFSMLNEPYRCHQAISHMLLTCNVLYFCPFHTVSLYITFQYFTKILNKMPKNKTKIQLDILYATQFLAFRILHSIVTVCCKLYYAVYLYILYVYCITISNHFTRTNKRMTKKK